MQENIIEVNKVTKVFAKQSGEKKIKEKFLGLEKVFTKKQKNNNSFVALDNISFSVKKGEFFGIVGRNGSGKSTLLKILAGVYSPSKGSVTINGNLTPFIELGVGFNPELSGRNNVFLNGALLGFTRKQILEMYDEIVEFAELENFMEEKLKNYSSGMQVRLAFSVAIRAKSDILLIDEVLAVGDAAFQRKCFDVFKKIKKEGKTVVFVTHDMGAVQEFCDRAIMIDSGKLVTIGKPREVALKYEVANSGSQDIELGKNSRPINSDLALKGVALKGAKNGFLKYNEDVTLEVTLEAFKKISIQLNLFILKRDGTYLTGYNTIKDVAPLVPDIGIHKLTCRIEKNQLNKGVYFIGVAAYTYDASLAKDEAPVLLDILDLAYGTKVPMITVEDNSKTSNGEFNLKAEWKL